MYRMRYFVLGFVLVSSLATNSGAEVIGKESSWKYLVERTTTVRDNLVNKKEVHVDRAFVYYGAGAKEVGGQIETVPQVVYVDEKLDRIPTATYYESAIVPRDSQKFGLTNKWSDEQGGSDPNVRGPAWGVPNAFNILPMRPLHGQLKQGLSWTHTWDLYIGWDTGLTFPATIKQEFTEYQERKGRMCGVIKYTIDGGVNTAENPEWFSEEELHKYRGGYSLKGNGTAHFDTQEEIIVEKEQTITWTRFMEKLSRLEDGTVGWKPNVDDEKVVTIKVSLQPEEEAAVETEDEVKEPSLPASSGWPSLSYVLIAAAIGIGIVCLILLLKKTAGSSKEKE